MDILSAEAVVDHYRLAAAYLLPQLAGRMVRCAGWQSDEQVQQWPAGPGKMPGEPLLETLLAQQVRWFSWEVSDRTPHTMTIGVGDGADLATAATAAHAVLEDLAANGHLAVASTDGSGGLLVWVPDPSANLQSLAADLAHRAPEIATTDPARADGRAWLTVAPIGSAVPVPYSLIDTADGTGLVLPLTMDEVAAVTAGMPLTVDPDQLPDRLRQYGDLAAALASG